MRNFGLKEFVDKNFRCSNKTGKFIDTIKNINRKGEIARDEQFLLFSQYFPSIFIFHTSDSKKNKKLSSALCNEPTTLRFTRYFIPGDTFN